MSSPTRNLMQRATHCVAHTALFCIGLFGVAAAVRIADPMPFHSWTRAKIHECATLDASFDTLFLGTSRMEFGLVPAEFDARSRELGHPTRSYNGGISGLRMHDVLHVLDWIGERPPSGLRRIVMELHDLDQHVNGGQWFTDTQLEMHAPSTIASRLASVAASRRGIVEQAQQAASVLLHGIANALALGQGDRIIDDWRALAAGKDLPETWRWNDAGWRAVESSTTPHVDQMHRDLVDHRADWERALADKATRITSENFVEGFRPEPFLEAAARLKSKGIDLVLVVMPTLTFDFYGREQAEALGASVLTIACDRPAENRPVFAWEHFYDCSHLSTAGAKAFSRHLAELLAETKNHGGKPPRPRYRALHGMSAVAEVVATGLTVRAQGIPLCGDLVAVLGRRADGPELAHGERLAVELPPLAQRALVRTGLDAASGTIAPEHLPEPGTYWLQVGCIREGAILDLTSPQSVRVPEPALGSEEKRR